MKAMELVAASKMRRATEMTLQSRPYAGEMRDMMAQIVTRLGAQKHVLLTGRPRVAGKPFRTLMIVAASDRGLCGGFNNQLLKKAFMFAKERVGDEVSILTVGRRVEQAVRRSGFPMIASFEAISNAPSYERARPIVALALKEFMDGKCDRVFMVYTDFKSALIQIPNVIQLLPIKPDPGMTSVPSDKPAGASAAWTFEPTPEALFDKLLPRVLEIQVYQALLESSASEQSARMMAMRSAGDAASDMLSDLTFSLNQARQSTITREISEISAGKAAIE